MATHQSAAITGLVVAARPFYLPGGLVVYALGVMLAEGGGRGHVGAIAVGALAVVLVHVVTHWVNDAEDVATDDATANPTVFTGGSRAIQRGLVTPALLMRAALVVSLVVVAIAVAAAGLGDPVAAALYGAILLLGYGYSGPPFCFGRRGLGEIVTATVMGLLVPLAGAHAAGGISPAIVALVPLLVVEIFFARLCTAYPDLEADRATGKRTLPVLLGPRGSAVGFAVVAVAAIVAGVMAAPALISAGWRDANTAGVAAAAALAAAAAGAVVWLVASRRAERRPVIVPIAGLGALSISLALLTLACFLR